MRTSKPASGIEAVMVAFAVVLVILLAIGFGFR
jgi:hypothetical protein